MLAVNAAHLRRRSPATAAMKPDISHAIVPTMLLGAPQGAWAADTLAAVEEEARSATNAAKSATSPVTALKVALEAMVEEDMAEEEAMVAAMEADAHSRLATPAVAMDTCPVTAPRVKSATTVRRRSPEVLDQSG